MRAADGNVWAVSRGGGVSLLSSDPPRVLRRFTPTDKTIGDADISTLVLDAAGAPWIATASGVERLDEEQGVFVSIAGIPHEAVQALGFAPDGELWLHRLGALERYRIDGVTALRSLRFQSTDGWPAMTASALTVASDGSIWVTSARGLWRVDPKTRAIRNFDTGDGLPSAEFREGALARSSDGTLFAGTENGVLAFDPAKLHFDTPAPPLRLLGLSVRRNGRLIALDAAAPIDLSYDDLDFTVAVRALSYANPASNHYRFQLSGFDPEWIDSERGERTYSQLPAGKYTLQVQGGERGRRLERARAARDDHGRARRSGRDPARSSRMRSRCSRRRSRCCTRIACASSGAMQWSSPKREGAAPSSSRKRSRTSWRRWATRSARR